LETFWVRIGYKVNDIPCGRFALLTMRKMKSVSGFWQKASTSELGSRKERLQDVLGRSGARFGTKVNDISCGQLVEFNVRL
jgi:hypothetical protein